jgi:hypothetical protein
MLQIQGRLWIHEREWVDVFGWGAHKSGQRITHGPVKIYRDEEFIKAIRKCLPRFVEELLNARAQLERDEGPFLRQGTPVPPEVDLIANPTFLTDADVDELFRMRRLEEKR